MVGRELPRARTTASAIKSADNGVPELDRAEVGTFEADDDGGLSSGGNPADKLLLVDRVGGGILKRARNTDRARNKHNRAESKQRRHRKTTDKDRQNPTEIANSDGGTRS